MGGCRRRGIPEPQQLRAAGAWLGAHTPAGADQRTEQSTAAYPGPPGSFEEPGRPRQHKQSCGVGLPAVGPRPTQAPTMGEGRTHTLPTQSRGKAISPHPNWSLQGWETPTPGKGSLLGPARPTPTSGSSPHVPAPTPPSGISLLEVGVERTHQDSEGGHLSTHHRPWERPASGIHSVCPPTSRPPQVPWRSATWGPGSRAGRHCSQMPSAQACPEHG